MKRSAHPGARQDGRLLAAAELRALARQAAERLVVACDPVQVVLFGSYARGEAHPGSDLDLLVVVPAGEEKRSSWERARNALRGVPLAKDVIVVPADELRRRGDTVGAVFRPALREGKVLYDVGRGFLAGDVPALSLIEVDPVSEEERLWTTRDWLAKMAEDLQVGRMCLDTTPMASSAACFHAQQAAEKALKAVLVYLQIQYPLTHLLNEVANAIPAGWPVAEGLPDLKWLSDWSIQSRYPGNWPPPSDDDARRALAEAQSIVDAVLRDLRAHGYEPES